MNRRIHLLATGVNTRGGANQYTMHLAQGLADRGYDVCIYCFDCEEKLEQWCQVERLQPFSVQGSLGTWRFATRLRGQHCRQQFGLVESSPADFVLASDQPLAWGYDQVFPGRTFIYVPHSLIAPREVGSYDWPSWFQKQTEIRTYRRLESWMLRRATRTVRFTETSCNEMRQYYGDRCADFTVFPQAVDLPTSIDSRSHRAGASGPLRALFVGRLVSSKNVALILEAITATSPGTMELDIVGDGPDRPRLEQLVRERGLESRVRFQGHCEDVGRWYEQADIFLFPSRLEYAPLVVLESMSFGVPVVAIRSDGTRYFNAHHEAIRHGIDSYLCEDETAFLGWVRSNAERAASNIASVRNGLRTVGLAAREKVVANHSWQSHLDHYQTLFGELAAVDPSLEMKDAHV